MRIKSITKLLTLAILFTFTLACKKDNPFNQNIQLVGSWTETPQNAQFSRTFFFGQDGAFTYQSRYIGVAPGATTLNGTYTINGNQLKINITQEISTQLGFPSVNAKVNYEYLDRATIIIAGNKLTINYFSAPLDVPVATTMVLIKN